VTEIVNAKLTIRTGVRESSVHVVPEQHKVNGSEVRISLDAGTFPTGEVSMTIFVSTDNGITFNSASMTTINPGTFRGPAPHFWVMTYSLNGIPTHFKYSTNSPSQFQTDVKLEIV